MEAGEFINVPVRGFFLVKINRVWMPYKLSDNGSYIIYQSRDALDRHGAGAFSYGLWADLMNRRRTIRVFPDRICNLRPLAKLLNDVRPRTGPKFWEHPDVDRVCNWKFEEERGW